MLDPKTEEQVSQYVLDLLEPTERAAFEARWRVDPELRSVTRDLMTNLEGLALAAPYRQAPPGAFARIQQRLPAGWRAWRLKRPDRWALAGWPLAACLALGWILSALLFSPNRNHMPSLGSSRPAVDIQPGRTSPRDNRPSSAPNPRSVDVENLAARLAAQQQRLSQQEENLQKEAEQKRQLARRLDTAQQKASGLERLLFQYLDRPEGLRRLTVVNLLDPQSRTTGLDFAAIVNDVLANEAVRNFAPTNAPIIASVTTPASTEAASGRSVTSDSPTLANQTTTSTFTTVTQNASAGRTSSLVASGTAGDSSSLQPGSIPNNTVPGSLSTGETLVTSTASTNGLSTRIAGVAVFDQTDQSGFLMFQGAPVLAQGQSYQVWAFDPQYPQPVNLGLITGSSSGFGQTSFKLPDLNLVPTRFVITVEPTGGSAWPTGPVVLEGPKSTP